jgi:hypothetical protein
VKAVKAVGEELLPKSNVVWDRNRTQYRVHLPQAVIKDVIPAEWDRNGVVTFSRERKGVWTLKLAKTKSGRG